MSKSHLLGWLIETVLKLVVIPLALAVIGWCGYRLKHRASQSWPLASGTVETATVRYGGDSVLRKRWILDTAYSYRVDGNWYSGFGEDRYATQAEADTAADRVRKRALSIRYNPEAPDRSLPIWTT